ncbi:GBS Bsp-like repeat-containing protein [Gordonibacter urolithinfaciens]|uniref:GBS Bsp-like repeat-containing protein n=5 Tax=Gordonibacter TaxID=644652 RepID=UPI00142D7B8D|nr:GBS Bsp-like repeat-containing protein [Gordonibacter urolithinfaciens]
MDNGGGFESVGTRNASETAEAPDFQSGSAEAESNQLAASDQTDDVDESEQNKASGESEESSVESETSEDTVLKESDQNAETSAAAYVYVESPEIDFGGIQNVVIGLADDVPSVSDARLTVRSETGGEWVVAASNTVEGAVLFPIDTTEMEAGRIELISFSYSNAGGQKETEDLFQYTDVHYSFKVLSSVSLFAEEADPGEVTVYSIDEAGTLSQESSLESAIEVAQANKQGEYGLAASSRQSRSATSRDSDVVVALDPGHGGSDGGASGFGLVEKNLNLKIAQYCQQELESYYGVRVVMTRTGDEYVGLLDRVARAVQQGASVFVSIHCNASGGSGAEVYIPNGSSYQHQTHVTGEALATKILQQITSLGLANRGVKVRDSEYYQGSGPYYYEDGHLADFYTVINESRVYGIPGIIVEHAFVDNASDAAFLSNEGNLRALGVADATGIAQQYGLSKSRVEVHSEINGSILELDTRNWGVDPDNVCFSVLAPTGETTWVQGYEQSDGSWTGSFDLGATYGVYDVCAYATIDGSIKEYRHIDVGYNKTDMTVELNGDILSMNTSNWGAPPDNVSFSVVDPTGAIDYCQGVRQADGSWSCEKNIAGGSYGSYEVKAWCSLDKGVTGFAVSSASVSVAEPTVAFEAAVSDGTLRLKASGFTLTPSNVCFPVTAPGGGPTKWYQGYRQADGSWTGSVDLGAEFGAYGEYSAQAYATYAGECLPRASATFSVAEPTVAFEAAVSDGTLRLKASGFTLTPSNVCFPVTAPGGGPTKWYQGYRQADGSWTGSVDLGAEFGAYGEYSAQAYATYAGECLPRASATFSVAEPTVAFEAAVSDGTLRLKASGFTLTPSNVCFPVTAPGGGPTKWYQGYRQADGSWTGSVDLGAEFGAYGEYSAQAYATYAGECLPRASATFSVAEPTVAFEAAVSDGTLRLKASGFTLTPSNVCFPVTAPGGGPTKWYQGYRQADGSWTGSVDLGAEFGAYGEYSAQAYATYAGECLPRASATFSVAEPTVAFEAAVSDGTLRLKASGFTLTPSNVCFPVTAPGGGPTKWYQGYRQADGSWTGSVDLGAEFGAYGEYSAQAYATYAGECLPRASATFSVAEPTVAFEAAVSDGTLRLKASGFTLTPSNVCFPVTAPGGGPTKWYQGYRQADGSWTGSVDLGAEFGAYGEYSAQAYATYAGECLPRASATFSISKELGDDERRLTLKATVSADQKTATVEASGGRLGASSAVRFPVWSDVGGQDDMIWYSASYSLVDGIWRATIPISSHKSPGSYNVHMYGTVFGEPVWSSTTFTIDEPSASVSIESQNEELGTFAVAVRDVSSASGVSKVQVPLWSAADQSDIRWYDATRQSDGSWRALVNIRDHKYSISTQRTYSAHVYLTAGNEVTALVGATSVGMQYKGSSGYGIMGVSNVDASQMSAFFSSKSKKYPADAYSGKGAGTIEQFCTILCEEAAVEGVRAEVVFAQAMKETGYLQFGGDVKAEQCNFAGIGATGNGVPGNSFADVRTGLRAQVQHLKAYASTEELVQVCVDPRFGYVKRGCAPTVESLGGKWATSQYYGVELVALIGEMMKTAPA